MDATSASQRLARAADGRRGLAWRTAMARSGSAHPHKDCACVPPRQAQAAQVALVAATRRMQALSVECRAARPAAREKNHAPVLAPCPYLTTRFFAVAVHDVFETCLDLLRATFAGATAITRIEAGGHAG